MDFEQIKKNLRIRDVLSYYGMLDALYESESAIRGPCPVHKGDNKTAFHVDKEKNLYYCFTRKHGGSVIDLIMEIERVPLKTAAEKAEEILRAVRNHKSCEKAKKTGNRPLGFELMLDPNHPYLDERGVRVETRKHFGIGYCRGGIFKGRICIPIHDEYGKLVAYSGRSIDGTEPKYLLPKGFKKSQVIYNYHRIKNTGKHSRIVVVEGFFDVFKLYQEGYSAVALIGSSISSRQSELLTALKQDLVLMFDGDEAGYKCTKDVIKALKGKKRFKVVKLRKGAQPDILTRRELEELLGKNEYSEKFQVRNNWRTENGSKNTRN